MVVVLGNVFKLQSRNSYRLASGHPGVDQHHVVAVGVAVKLIPALSSGGECPGRWSGQQRTFILAPNRTQSVGVGAPAHARLQCVRARVCGALCMRCKNALRTS